jgi:hypothetical protein
MDQAVAAKSIQPGQVFIKGRISSVRKAGAVFLHLVTLPAPDSYTSPSTVEIGANARLGQKDEDISQLCRIAGYRRSFKATDKDTGEISTIHTADNRLFAVE